MVMLCRFVGAVVLVLTVGCNAPEPEGQPGPPTTAAPASAPSVSGKAPAGAIITLEPSTAREFPLPDGPAIMDQYAKQFVPDVLLVRVGQPVEFRNSEDSPHNVNVSRMPTGTALFNTSTAPYQKFVYTFAQPGQYSVTCDIHPGMLATLVATTTPYAAVADATGAFAFNDLAPGAYKLAWMASGGSGEKTIEVSTGAVNVAVGGS
jgi:plastocyanin